MRIYLIGYMGSGKTTAGKRLAKIMNFPFYDLDKMIEECSHYSIADIFAKFDEVAFRQLEKNTLHKTSSIEKAIISTGGGTPCFFDNMEWIRSNGISVYLKMSSKSLTDRILNSKKKRPLTKDKSPSELLEYVEKHLGKREKYYRQADIIVKGEDLNIHILHHYIVQKIISRQGVSAGTVI